MEKKGRADLTQRNSIKNRTRKKREKKKNKKKPKETKMEWTSFAGGIVLMAVLAAAILGTAYFILYDKYVKKMTAQFFQVHARWVKSNGGPI